MCRPSVQCYHCLLKNENYIDLKYILMFFLSHVHAMHAIGVKLVLSCRFLSSAILKMCFLNYLQGC